MLENLKSLKEDMKNKGWTICSFLFKYEATEYIVLVKRFVGSERRTNQYALVRLHFMKERDLCDDLQLEANGSGLIIDDIKRFREYFGIEFSKNIGDIIKQFSAELGKVIPADMPMISSKIEKEAMVKSLSKSDSEDPSKIYCTGVKRNAAGNKRSEFNADKTKLLRESLYNHFKNDESISFCYSLDVSKENDNATILRNFSINIAK